MQQAFIIAKQELKQAFNNLKVLFVLIVSILFAVVIASSGIIQLIAMLFLPREVTILLSSSIMPSPVFFTYYFLYAVMPIIIVLLGHDSISSDIEKKYIRGVISNIERNSYLFGKFLYLFAVTALLSFILLISFSIFSLFKIGEPGLTHTFLFFLYLLPFIAANIALTLFFSIISKKTSSSLFHLIVFYSFMFFFNYIASQNSGLLFLNNINILSYINDILIPGSIIAPMLTFVAYFVIFFSLAFIIFRRADL